MDGNFHSIIDPKRYGIQQYFKVFNYYWSCYFVIVEDIVKYLYNDIEIKDLNEECINNELFFPFIFGQSTVKPIVHKYQIENFIEMIKILEESDVLVILGYNINEDDNHINSFIRDFALKNKVVVVGEGDKGKEYVCNKLRLNSDCPNIVYCKVDYHNENNEVIINELLNLKIIKETREEN